ncbi:RidA family protein [Serratia marcescens]|jgi:2-iminobutanoate/2-iminopropanoate deaminase|uniref:RidA family protein n=1 Tax=Serratia marcescens TaxID=615 RepID=A0AAP8TN28_SERMA|nr:RidA family protein [Serratia marcescens]MBN5204605.1 RidA family protein [Serratia marcescens]PNO62771.1 RidA family protein [Serratia marcescens]
MKDEVLYNASGGFPPAGHYSSSCTANGMVYISGQLPITFSGENLAGGSFALQVSQVLANLDACLDGAGVGRAQLVQVRVYLTNIDWWPTFNALYAEWIGEFRPARAVAGVSQLHYGAAVEVEAVALAAL